MQMMEEGRNFIPPASTVARRHKFYLIDFLLCQ